jgi:TIR domain
MTSDGKIENQEDIYNFIYYEQWTIILNILYQEKEKIKNDALLSFATKTFEAEFLKKVSSYEINNKNIAENLDTLYLLHHGKFYQLSDENYKFLIVEIVKRKSINDAINYAKEFPEDEICKKVIEEFEQKNNKQEENKTKQKSKLPLNWIETYNRIFELINNPANTATYFSGPRFIDTVRQFEPYFSDYTQYINQRNIEGKSTSRKIFYYDILIGLEEKTRINVVNRILEILNPFETEKVTQIKNLIEGSEIKKSKVELHKNIETEKKPIVFISYSWDNDEHKKWVLDLANKLCADGIDVILDRYYLKPGVNLPHFVEKNISSADRIIIIFTKNYKLKADKRTGGVGYEYSIMNVDLYKNQTSNEKIIPILREGTTEESIPTFMQQFIHIDTRNDENFENSYIDLLREIHNEPEIKKPEIGNKPKFG